MTLRVGRIFLSRERATFWTSSCSNGTGDTILKTRRWLGSPTYSLEEVRWLLGDPGFRVGGYLNLRRRQKLSMEGLRGDGGEG